MNEINGVNPVNFLRESLITSRKKHKEFLERLQKILTIQYQEHQISSKAYVELQEIIYDDTDIH